MTSVPVVHAAGPAAERGREVGRSLADTIGRSLDFYRGFLRRRGLGPEDLPRLLRPYRRAAEEALPELVAELDAMAEGAGADPWELLAVNAFEELEASLTEAAVDRCTAFAVRTPDGTILGHNEQWYAGDGGNVAVVIEVPEEGPAFASPTVVTCLPAVGLNAAGVAQAIMSLSAGDDGVGIPRVFVSRHTLPATDTADAIARAGLPGRAGGYAHLLASEGGEVVTIETTAERIATPEGTAAHTNHYLDPELAGVGLAPSDGSLARLQRVQTLLRQQPPASPQDAMRLLADHESAPQPICLHPDPADGDEAESVLFSMVCHVEERRMWVAAGNPCTAPFEEIALPEVA